MNNSIKLLSFLLLFLGITSCESNDDENVKKSVEAGYTYVRDAALGAITFINTSEFADSYFWDFGDGTTSTSENPTKILPANLLTSLCVYVVNLLPHFRSLLFHHCVLVCVKAAGNLWRLEELQSRGPLSFAFLNREIQKQIGWSAMIRT